MPLFAQYAEETVGLPIEAVQFADAFAEVRFSVLHALGREVGGCLGDGSR